mmetsp:Transcript_42948/g.89825  ORF Transcript_42948/g.89825 Transcript_42948/m.89825 type:complete len:144 (-) Transcript_42948:370-801(-)
MNWTVVVVAGTLAIAAANWLLIARHTFRGPKRADSSDAPPPPADSSSAAGPPSAAVEAAATAGPLDLQVESDDDDYHDHAATMSVSAARAGVAREAALAEMPPALVASLGTSSRRLDTAGPDGSGGQRSGPGTVLPDSRVYTV